MWEQRFGEELLGTISVYNYRIKDLIDVIELPGDPDTEPLFQYQNVNRVKANGLELGIDARLRNGFKEIMPKPYGMKQLSETLHKVLGA